MRIFKQLDRIISGRNIDEPDSEFVRSSVIIYLFTVIGLVFMSFFAIKGFIEGETILALVLLTLGGMTMSVFFFLRVTKNHTIAGNAMVFIMFVLELFLIVTGGADKTGPLWLYVFPAIALFAVGRKNGSVFIVLLLLVVIIVFYVEPKFTVKYQENFKYRFIASFVAVYIISYVYEFIREKMHKSLLSSNKQKVDYLERVLQQNEEIKVQAENLETANKELENLSLVASNTDNAVFIMNAKGDIEWLNKGFEKLHGYNLEEFKENVGSNLLDVTDNSELSSNIHNCIVQKETLVYSAKNKTRNGEYKWLQTTLTPVIDDKGELKKIVAIDSDFTEIKETELELREAIQLEESSKIKPKLITDASSEITAPLDNILRETQRLQSENLPKGVQERIDAISTNGKELLGLVKNMLELIDNENNLQNTSNRISETQVKEYDHTDEPLKPQRRTKLNVGVTDRLDVVYDEMYGLDFQETIRRLGRLNSDDLDIVNKFFRDEVFLDYEKIRKTLRVKQMRDFANKLVDIAEAYRFEELKKYAKTLILETDKFNISKMKKLVYLFGHFVNEYRKHILDLDKN